MMRSHRFSIFHAGPSSPDSSAPVGSFANALKAGEVPKVRLMLMTECEPQILSAYLDDVLDAPRRAGVEQHLATCAACRAELESLRGVSMSMRDATLDPLDDATRIGLRAAVDDHADAGAVRIGG